MNGKSMEDIESLYLQEENEKYINNTYGKEQWVQVAGKNVIHGADAEFYSGLISLDCLNDIYIGFDWDISDENCGPGFQYDEGDNSQYMRNCSEDKGQEVLVYRRDFYGIKSEVMEVSEEFRLLNNLYYEDSDKTYYSIKKMDNVMKL